MDADVVIFAVLEAYAVLTPFVVLALIFRLAAPNPAAE
jgi:hypothetical protein